MKDQVIRLSRFGAYHILRGNPVSEPYTAESGRCCTTAPALQGLKHMSPTQTVSNKVSLPAPPAGAHLDSRSFRARSERMAVSALGGSVYEVDTDHDTNYLVDLELGRCTCPDHVFRDVRCKHIRRVAMEITAGRVPAPGKQFVACERCGERLVVSERDGGPHFCEECELRPGDAVVDRETDDLLIVVRVTNRRANEVVVPDREVSVADYPTNEGYPADDLVVEAVYPLPANLRSSSVNRYRVRRYSFPLSRLEPRQWRDENQLSLADFPA